MSETDEQYWEKCAAGEFALRRCGACRQWLYPPPARCPYCLGTELVWERASGRGTVWSWVRFHQSYFVHLRDRLPYPVIAVRLAEGPIMISGLVGDPERLTCDAPVELVFDAEDGTTLPKFRLV